MAFGAVGAKAAKSEMDDIVAIDIKNNGMIDLGAQTRNNLVIKGEFDLVSS